MPANGSLPLSHIKVLDLTRARAGPTCVRQLADWGAEAIKIEMPVDEGEGDGMGGLRTGFDFQNLHRNKKSITLNLKAPEGLALFKRMVADADVLVENYRPGVKHRLGIDPEAMMALNPRLIYASLSGFGQTGPYRDRPGLDQIAQGLGGLMSITGLPGQGPVRVGIPISDLMSGIFLAQGVLAALYERERTGKGRWVRTSLLEAMISMLDFQAARWLVGHEVPPQAGNNHPTGIPTGVVKTADGHINVAASGSPLYERFCEAIGAPELIDDERFNTAQGRSKRRDEFMALIAPIFAQKTSAEWVRLLNEAGVPCGPILTIDQTFANEQVRHLGIAQKVRSRALGELELVGQPINLSRTPTRLRAASPEMGEHNEEVYGRLGLNEEELAGLRERGVI